MYNIASKHQFTDGNKRAAIVTSNSFLEYNGYSIWKLPFRKSKKFITEVATGAKKEKDCQKFIKTHITKLVIPSETKENIRKL